jgi:hypothetical protein
MTIPTLGRRGLLAAAGLAGFGGRRAFATAAAWDLQPEIRPAVDVVPPDLLKGPHFAVDPSVTTFTYQNRFTVASDFGPFEAPSDARLRRLIREIAAIAELKKMQQTDAFEKAAIEAGKSPFHAAKNLIDRPVETLSAVPQGIGALFDRVNEQVRRSGKSQYEDDTAKSVLAVSGFKRDYAAKLGVDVYSSNPVLQAELNRLAWASAAGNLTLGALSMVTGALVLQVASNVRLLEQARGLVEATPPSELSKRNRAELARIGVTDAAADRFLQNRTLSPRHQMIMVASMVALGDIPGRAGFIAYAARSDSEDQALLFQQMAELLAGYSAGVSPVRQIDFLGNLPLAYTDKKRTVTLLPVDRVLWTERSAGLAEALATKLPQPHRAKTTEIWLTGDASPLAEAGLKKLGLGLEPHCGKRLPLLD